MSVMRMGRNTYRLWTLMAMAQAIAYEPVGRAISEISRFARGGRSFFPVFARAPQKGILTRMREAASYEQALSIWREGRTFSMASDDTRRKWDKALEAKTLSIESAQAETLNVEGAA